MKLPFAFICLALLNGCGDPSATGARVPAELVEQQAEEDAAVFSEARAALAAHLKLPDVADSELVLFRSKLWSNGSMGCGKPGQFYTQALVDGYKIVLALGGVQHHVHMGKIHNGKSSGFVCEQLQDSDLADVEHDEHISGEIPSPKGTQNLQTK